MVCVNRCLYNHQSLHSGSTIDPINEPAGKASSFNQNTGSTFSPVSDLPTQVSKCSKLHCLRYVQQINTSMYKLVVEFTRLEWPQLNCLRVPWLVLLHMSQILLITKSFRPQNIYINHTLLDVSETSHSMRNIFIQMRYVILRM